MRRNGWKGKPHNLLWKWKGELGEAMKINRNKIITGLTICMVFGFVLNNGFQSKIKATNFEGNEQYWTNVCSQYTTDQKTIATCNEYKAYLNNKKNEKLFDAANTQKEIDAMQGDLAKLGDLAYEYQQKVTDVEAEIASMQASIEAMRVSVAEVEQKIALQQEKIAARKQVIAQRMVAMQSKINTNVYLDFIMGSESFSDFLQRAQSVKTITDYDNQQVDLLNQEIASLDVDKEELLRIQETMQSQQDVLDARKVSLVAAHEESKRVLNELEVRQNQLASQRDSASSDANSYASLMPAPAVAPPVVDTPPGDTGGGSGGGSGSLNWNRNFYSGFYSSPYNVISNVNLTGQCTWYCFGRASEVNGSHLRGKLPTGNAQDWYRQASARGLAVGSAPRTNAIIVWGFGQYGHVAFVESFGDGVITISEGNVNAPGGGLGYGTSLETAIAYTQTSTLSYASLCAQRGNPIGFIYF